MANSEIDTSVKKPVGVIITCGSRNTWDNTFDVMCENYSHDTEIGLQQELFHHNYGLIFERIDATSETIHVPQMLRKNMVSGVFLIGGMYQEGFLHKIQNYNLPTVLIGSDYPEVDYVTSDYTGGVYQGIKYLISKGHRDILFINGPDRSGTSALKMNGLRKAFNECSIQVSEKRCLKSEFSGEGGYWATKTAYEKRGLHPTAIFAGCDTIAAGVLGYLYERRFFVPDDVSVISFERSILTEYVTPCLTSIELNKRMIGSLAAQMLLKRIENPDLPPQHKVVPVELKIGASVRPLLETEAS